MTHTTDTIRRMFGHLEWANERVLSGIDEQEDVPNEVLVTLTHLLATEEVWLARIEQREPAAPVWPEPDLARCHDLARASRASYETFLDALDDDTLQRSVRYANSRGDEFKTAVGDILVHVALHGAYHRGQIATRLRIADLDPVATDYIAYVRGAPAATRD